MPLSDDEKRSLAERAQLLTESGSNDSRAFEKALELDPGHDQARENKNRLLARIKADI